MLISGQLRTLKSSVLPYVTLLMVGAVSCDVVLPTGSPVPTTPYTPHTPAPPRLKPAVSAAVSSAVTVLQLYLAPPCDALCAQGGMTTFQQIFWHIQRILCFTLWLAAQMIQAARAAKRAMQTGIRMQREGVSASDIYSIHRETHQFTYDPGERCCTFCNTLNCCTDASPCALVSHVSTQDSMSDLQVGRT